jgi:hypothetical protein
VALSASTAVRERVSIAAALASLAHLLEATLQIKLRSVGLKYLVEQRADELKLAATLTVESLEMLAMTEAAEARSFDLNGPAGALRAEGRISDNPETFRVQLRGGGHRSSDVAGEAHGAGLAKHVSRCIAGPAKRNGLPVGGALHGPDRAPQ